MPLVVADQLAHGAQSGAPCFHQVRRDAELIEQIDRVGVVVLAAEIGPQQTTGDVLAQRGVQRRRQRTGSDSNHVGAREAKAHTECRHFGEQTAQLAQLSGRITARQRQHAPGCWHQWPPVLLPPGLRVSARLTAATGWPLSRARRSGLHSRWIAARRPIMTATLAG
jgi:hypothetical protein